MFLVESLSEMVRFHAVVADCRGMQAFQSIVGTLSGCMIQQKFLPFKTFVILNIFLNHGQIIAAPQSIILTVPKPSFHMQ